MDADDMFNPEYSPDEMGDGDNPFLRLGEGDQAEIVMVGKWEAVKVVFCNRSVAYDEQIHGADAKVRTKYLLNVAQNTAEGWTPKLIEMSWTTRDKYHQALESGANGRFPFNYRRKGSRFNTEYYFTPMLNKPLREEDLEAIKSLHYPNLRVIAKELFAPKEGDPPPTMKDEPESQSLDLSKVSAMSDDLGLPEENKKKALPF